MGGSTDFRAEVLAAELLSAGLPFEQLYFKTISLFKRTNGRDISDIKLDEKDGGDEQLVLELNREGLYDMLPEGLFHFKQSTGKEGKSQEAILDNIRQTREEEADARKFFEPIENEFFHRRLQLVLKERDMLKADSERQNRGLFDSIFGDPGGLDNQQVVSLLHILPMVYSIRGDIPKMTYSLCKFTGLDISIRQKPPKAVGYRYLGGGAMPLGAAMLGIDAVAGDYFQPGETVFEVNVHGVPKSGADSFLEGGSNYKAMDYLMGYILPYNARYELLVHVKREERGMFLADENHCSFLNLDAYLEE